MTDRLTETEISMILDTYMYFDYPYAKDGESLKEIISNMNATHPEVVSSHPNEYSILSQAVEYEEVGKLKISCQSRNMGYNEGTRGVCFSDKDKDTVYVAFRGTADGEWVDNGKGMTNEGSLQQKEAVRYFDEAVEKLNVNQNTRLITTGHSKGGNKVQYITMESEKADLIDKCYSIDGQGHSDAAISKWKNKYSEEEYSKRVSKIYGINGQNDFVNVLGNSIILASHIKYVDTPSKTDDFAAYHDITRMFGQFSEDENGVSSIIFSPHKNRYVLNRGKLGDFASLLSEDIMKLDPDIRDGCATTLMQSIEILNKGKVFGVNYEHATGEDILTFLTHGAPLIINSLMMQPKGTELLNSIKKTEGFIPSIESDVFVDVNYRALAVLSLMMNNSAKKLEKLLEELSLNISKMHLVIQGTEYKKNDMNNAVLLLYDMGRKMYGISSLQCSISTKYEKVDTEII